MSLAIVAEIGSRSWIVGPVALRTIRAAVTAGTYVVARCISSIRAGVIPIAIAVSIIVVVVRIIAVAITAPSERATRR
jgi:hypothetical protein